MSTRSQFHWRKSTYSGGADNGCVEIGWRKSTYSGGASDNCVEVAPAEAGMAIRDSKDPAGGLLELSVAQWRAFAAAVTG